MITLPVNSLVAKTQNTRSRMPAFLTIETAKIWLYNELSYSERKKALDPVSDEFLNAYSIIKVGDEEEYNKLLEIC